MLVRQASLGGPPLRFAPLALVEQERQWLFAVLQMGSPQLAQRFSWL